MLQGEERQETTVNYQVPPHKATLEIRKAQPTWIKPADFLYIQTLKLSVACLTDTTLKDTLNSDDTLLLMSIFVS